MKYLLIYWVKIYCKWREESYSNSLSYGRVNCLCKHFALQIDDLNSQEKRKKTIKIRVFLFFIKEGITVFLSQQYIALSVMQKCLEKLVWLELLI